MRFFLLILFSFSFAASWGQTPQAFYTRAFGAQEGLLVDDVINYVSCDSKGYVWISTGNGLYRFSGSLFKKFPVKKKAAFTLPANNVRFFIEDKKGNYYLSADGFGLSTYEDSTSFFKPFILKNDTLSLKSYMLVAPFVDNNNNLWLGVETKGLLCINTITHEYRFYDTKDPASGNNGFVSTAWINSIIQLKNGEILAGTNTGILKLDPGTAKITHYYHAFKNIDHSNDEIFEDEDGSWWMGTWAQGLLHYFPATDKWEQYFIRPNSINGTQNILRSVLYKSKDELWISSYYGLYIFNKTEKKFYPATDMQTKINQLAVNDNSLRLDPIPGWYITKDKQGNLWTFNDKTITRVTLTGNFFPFTLVPFEKVDNPAAFSFIQGFPCSGHAGQYLLCSGFGNGFYLYDSLKNKSVFIRGSMGPIPPYHINFSLLKSKQLWLCTSKGLFIYDCMLQKFIDLPSKELEAAVNNKNISSIAITDSLIWISSDHLFNFNQQTKAIHTITGDGIEELPPFEIYQLLADTKNDLWLAFGGGKNVYCIQAQTGKLFNYNLNKEINAGNGVSIAQSPDGSIFFSSRGNGLYKIENPLSGNEKIRLYTTADGLPSERIHNVFCDAGGYLWLSTSNGLCICNSSDMQPFNFSAYNNFPEPDFHGMPYPLGNAEFLLPLIHGYTIVNRDSLLKQVNKIVPIAIHKFSVNGKAFPQSVDYGGSLVLPYYQNSFSLDFSALCFDDAEGIDYYYNIKGLNKDTVSISNRNNISLYAIPPGNYTLQIFVKERNRPLQPPGYQLHFKINPPFWKTWWFISLCVLAVIVILYMLYRYRINQLLRLQKVRSNIAQDLHDDVGSTMTTISILSDVAKKQIENDLKPAPIMDEIGSNARELMEKLDDIVWSVNPKNDNLNQMVLRMKKQAIDLLGNKDIKVNFDVPENIDSIGLPMESRRNVFLIYKEAVHNISKYAEAKNVNIVITISKNELKVTISDDGKGFIIQEAGEGNGLENMQERAKQSGGKCNIESEKGKGTIVAFSIPV